MTYIVMDAPGCYGSHAEVHSRHDDFGAAVRAAQKMRGRGIVSSDGGYAEDHQPGCMIQSQFARQYEILWSLAAERAQAAAEKAQRETTLREERLARRYGRGSNQYYAALTDLNFRG